MRTPRLPGALALSRLVVVTLVLALLVWLHPLWLQALGNLLLLRQAPAEADAVVVLAGNARGGRLLRGAELVRDGFAPRLYVLDDTVCTHGACLRWSEVWRSQEFDSAIDLEAIIPRERVVPLLDDLPLSEGTYEEAQAAWSRLHPLGIRRILLVTDEFHSRRATLTWRKVVGPDVEVRSVPCTERCITMRNWWQDRQALLAVWLEVPKWAVYLAQRRVW